jgi:hypothetical protein
MARAERSVQALGLRVASVVRIEHAKSRIELQGSATALLAEVDCDCGETLDSVLHDINRDVTNRRYSAVISSTPDVLDPIFAAIDQPAIEVIIGADDAQRAAALALAIASRSGRESIGDIASDRNAERLRQLSDEVGRIASTLARLSAGPSSISAPAISAIPGDAAPLSVETVRSIIRARRLRTRFFPEDFFGDPAWDMLLDLLQAEIAQLRVPVSSLCIAAAVPATTALRWIKTLVVKGLFIRRADPHDGRRVFVELAPEASQALRKYFAEVGPVPVI